MMTRIKIITSFLVYFSLVASTQAVTPSPIEKKAFLRWNHAKELVGKNYHKSIVKTGESIAVLDDVLFQWTHTALKGHWKSRSAEVSKTIIKESEKYGFDPVFLMAVIQNESSFKPEIIGSFGEIGLMQITPQTAQWITNKYNLPWKGAESLKNPTTNIKIGAAYMAYLREKFAFHSQLYLAAYNMGSANVYRNLKKQVWPKIYPSRVMHHYVKFYAKLQVAIQKT